MRFLNQITVLDIVKCENDSLRNYPCNFSAFNNCILFYPTWCVLI